MLSIYIKMQTRKIGDLICSLVAIKKAKEYYEFVFCDNQYSFLKDYVDYIDGFVDTVPAGSKEIIFKHNGNHEQNLIDMYLEQFCEQTQIKIKDFSLDVLSVVHKSVPNKQPVVVIFPYSSFPCKDYPYGYELYEILNKLYDTYIVSKFPLNKNVKNINLPLDRLIGFLGGVDLIIAVDTFALHIAGILKKPAIGLFGSTNPAVVTKYYSNVLSIKGNCFYQYCNLACKKNKNECMYVIPKESIAFYTYSILDNSNKETTKKHINDSKPKVAVFRMRGLGDLLMLRYSLNVLARNYDIDLYTSKNFSELMLLNNEKYNIIPINYNHHKKNDIVDLPNVDISKYSKVFNLMNAFDFGEKAYTKNRFETIAELLGVKLDNIHPDNIVFSEQEVKFIKNVFPKYICIQVDADGTRRKMTDAFLTKLLKKLKKEINLPIILVGKVRKNLNSENIIDLTGHTNTRQFALFVCYSEVFVGTDSSGMHIRAMSDYKKDMIVILSTTGKSNDGVYAHTAKYDQSKIFYVATKAKCSPCWDKQNCNKCWKKIEVDLVVKALKKFLASA